MGLRPFAPDARYHRVAANAAREQDVAGRNPESRPCTIGACIKRHGKQALDLPARARELSRAQHVDGHQHSSVPGAQSQSPASIVWISQGHQYAFALGVQGYETRCVR